MTFRSFRFLVSASSLLLCPLSFPRACTIGAFGPNSTVDGRTILWKNRDVSDPNQAMRFFRGSRYRYVTNVYAGDTFNAWAGYNEVGFAIMNSNSFNIAGRDGLDADDGTIMSLALATCASLEEFSLLLDSLNISGRETPANFGVFDSTGATAMFEASNLFYVRHDADEDSLGFQIRANYSMSGNPGRMTGRERYLRAMQLAVPARQQDRIDVRFIIYTLARDVGALNFDPYPLPFDGVIGELPRGYLPTESSLCRVTTRSVEIMVGPRPGWSAASSMMWVMLGPAEVSIPVPVWVQAGPMPELIDGTHQSILCDEALRLHDFIHSAPEFPGAVNTFRLKQLYDNFAATESLLLRCVDSCEAAWGPTGPTSEQARWVTSYAANLVLGAYVDFWDSMNRDGTVVIGDRGAGAWQNVSRDTVLFRLPPGTATGTVGIYDAGGRQVAAMAPQPGQSLIRWLPAGLRSGSYFAVFPALSGLRPLRFTFLR